MAQITLEIDKQVVENIYNEVMGIEIDGVQLKYWIHACARFKEALHQQCFYCEHFKEGKCTNPNGLSNPTDEDFCSRGKFIKGVK